MRFPIRLARFPIRLANFVRSRPSPCVPSLVVQWEAWHAVKHYTKEQAMSDYAKIIEGLVSVLGASASPNLEEEDEEDEEEYDEEEDKENGEEEEEEEEDREVEAPPEVEQTLWSTSFLSLAPGSTFEVPLTVVEAARCSYNFSIVAGWGPIGFALKSAGGYGAGLLGVAATAAAARGKEVANGAVCVCVCVLTHWLRAAAHIKVPPCGSGRDAGHRE